MSDKEKDNEVSTAPPPDTASPPQGKSSTSSTLENMRKHLSNLPDIIPTVLYKIYRIFLQPFIAIAWVVHGLRGFIARHPIIMLLFVVGAHFFTSIFNPFNLDRTGDENAAHFLNRISSPFYGADRKAQEDIIVVLITPDDIRDYLGGGHWPPTYDAQLRILKEIQRHDPTAIFMDTYYSTPQLPPGAVKNVERKSVDVVAPAWELFNEELKASETQDEGTTKSALEAERKNLSDQEKKTQNYVKKFADGLITIRNDKSLGTPIFIGPVGGLNGEHSSDFETLKPLRDFAELPPGATRDPYNKSAIVDISVTFDSVIYYPRDMSDTIPDSERKPAAHALYYEYCKDRVARQSPNTCDTFKYAGMAKKALAVKWGYGYPSWINELPEKVTDIGDWENPLTPCPSDGNKSKLRNAFSFFYESIFEGEREVRRRGLNRCFYHAAIRVEKLFSDLPESQLKHLFENKLVLIGADQPALADNFDTPVHGVVPGVFIHAMALDNLITLGNRHHKVPGRRIGQMNSTDLFSGIVLLIVGFLLYAVREKDMAMKAQGNSRYLYRWSRYLAIVIGFSALSMYLAARIGNWPLGNIFEVGLSSLSMLFILEVLANRPEPAQTKQQPTNTLTIDNKDL